MTIRGALLAMWVMIPVSVGAQDVGARFLIRAVADTTVSFDVGTAKWIRPGLPAIAVDPKRRDALVARFLVKSVAEGVALAVLTGQAAPVTTDLVLVIDRPPTRWYRRASVYFAFLVGSALGLAVGLTS